MVANDLDIVLIDVTFYLQHVQKLVVKLLIKINIIWDGRLKGHSVSQKVSVNCFWVCHIINYRPIYLYVRHQVWYKGDTLWESVKALFTLQVSKQILPFGFADKNSLKKGISKNKLGNLNRNRPSFQTEPKCCI